jgi:hypothetical protein
LLATEIAHPKTPFFFMSASKLFTAVCSSVALAGSTYYFNRPAPSRIQNAPPPVAATTPAETMPRAATGSETNAPASLAPSIPAPSTSPQENLSARRQSFRGGDSSTFLRTNVTTYWAGERCPGGKVLQVGERRALIDPLNGDPAYWIVAEDDPKPAYQAPVQIANTYAPQPYSPQQSTAFAPQTYPPQQFAPHSYVSATPIPTGNAEWHTRATPEIDADERKMDAYLHRTTGVIQNREMLPGTNFTTTGTSSPR